MSEWDLYENSIAFLVQSVDHSLFTRLILSGHLIRLNGLCGFHGLKSVDGRDYEKISIVLIVHSLDPFAQLIVRYSFT